MPLMQLIERLWPYLAFAAAAIATTIVSLNMEAGFRADAELIDVGTMVQKIGAWRRMLVNLKYILAYQLVQAVFATQGINIQEVEHQAEQDTQIKIAALTPVITFPTFVSLDEADGWYNSWVELFQAGAITVEEWQRVVAHYQAEVSRIQTIPATPPPITPPVFTPWIFAAITFTTMAALEVWWQGVIDLTNQGRVSAIEYSKAAAWYQSELSRLSTAEGGGGAGTATLPADLVAAIAQLTSTIKALADAGVITDTQLQTLTAQVSKLTVAGTMPVTGVIDVPDVTTGLNGLSKTLTESLPLALSAAMALAMTAAAGTMGHNSQQGKYTCMSGFLGGILNVLGKVGPQVAAGALFTTDNPIRKEILDKVTEMINKFIDLSSLPAPASEDTAEAAASARLLSAIGYGLIAQAISYTAEALTPLKTIGFNQIAGLMADVAGFKRIADGVMGTVESAGLYTPLKWAANRKYRPTLPSDALVEQMYAKYALTKAETVDILQRAGFPDMVIDRLPSFLYRDPRFGELIRAFQLQPPDPSLRPDQEAIDLLNRANIAVDDDWFIKYKLAKSGLERIDIEAFTPVVKAGIIRREQTLRYDQITSLYREGYITRDRAKDEIEAALVPKDLVTYRLEALDLMREYNDLEDTRQMITTALTKGFITEGEASQQLTGAGMDSGKVAIQLLRAKLSLQPRSTTIFQSESVTPPVINAEVE